MVLTTLIKQRTTNRHSNNSISASRSKRSFCIANALLFLVRVSISFDVYISVSHLNFKRSEDVLFQYFKRIMSNRILKVYVTLLSKTVISYVKEFPTKVAWYNACSYEYKLCTEPAMRFLYSQSAQN